MTSHRQHPRGHRPGLYVAGGLPPATALPQEDVPSGPLAGRLEAAESPVSQPDLADTDAVAAAILWDRAQTAEPYQVDITRGMEDTVRMGGGLSAAVRLEMLADRMQEEARDQGAERFQRERLGLWEEELEGRGGPRLDPVSGAELDPVDGLPIGEEDLADEPITPGPRPGLVTAPRMYAMAPPATSPPEYGPPVDATPPPVARAARVLDWASRHDPRSLEFPVRRIMRGPAPLADREWAHGPILDQGTAPPLTLHDASGCTGHAGVNAANVLELAADPATPVDQLLGHNDAMRLYEAAQDLDDWPGEDYPGTSVLALMKAGVQLGLWSHYRWAFGTRDIAQAILQVGPVLVGVPMLAGMMNPGPDGIVTVSGEDEGGHCLCLFALRMTVAGKAGPWFGALQTWGEGVGDHGVIWIHHRDAAQLLHGTGEAAVPLMGA